MNQNVPCSIVILLFVRSSCSLKKIKDWDKFRYWKRKGKGLKEEVKKTVELQND